MKKFIAGFAIFLIGTIAYAENAFVGITYTQIIDEVGFGVTGSYDDGEFELSGQLQQAGGIYRGKYHVSYTFDIGEIGVRPYIDGLVKGYAADDLGRQSDFGIALDFPSGQEGIDFGVGIFGRNAGAFGPPNAGDILEGKGFDPGVLEDRGLYDLTPAPTGLTIKTGDTINVLVFTGFTTGGIDVDLKFLPQIIGDGVKAHQLLSTFATDVPVNNDLDVKLGLDLGLQRYDGTLEYEIATNVAIGLNL